MTKITLHLEKSVHENAAIYFDKAKKAKKKIDGASIALIHSRKKLEKHMKKEPEELTDTSIQKRKKKEWFEKFRWFYTSDNLLVIGGRDATTNEIVIKKHTDKNDVVCHTDMAGSPFFVIKSEGNEIPETSLQEATDATASFSRAWKKGLTTTNTFHVTPDQVTKEANAGESLPKGAFMIRGKTNYLNPTIKLGIGLKDDRMMCAPVTAIEKHCENYMIITQGERKPSDIAKDIKKRFKYNDLDEIIRILPSGGCKIEEIRFKPENKEK